MPTKRTTMETKPKLTIRRNTELRKEIYRSNPVTTIRIKRCLDFYEAEAGREVSATPVIRRALELLDEHLASVRKKADRQHELDRLIRNLI